MNPPNNAGDSGLIPNPGRPHMLQSNQAPEAQLEPETGSRSYWTHTPQPQEPDALKPVPCNEKPSQWEAWAPPLEKGLTSPQLEKSVRAVTKTQHGQ